MYFKMRVEIPECKRCCCCVPLRHGILVFGFINLIFSIFIVVLVAVKCYTNFFTDRKMAMYKGVVFYSQLWFSLILYTVEIVFNIVLLIGAYKKNTRLIRAYYYYGITTALASLITFIIAGHGNIYWSIEYYAYEICLAICGLGIQVYLLLLIRSELLKIRQDNRFCYVNHATEIVIETPVQTGRNPF